MWAYNSYRAESTITTQSQSARSVTTQSASNQIARIVNPGVGDSFTRTDTITGATVGETYVTQTSEAIHHDVFAGTNSTGGSNFYGSIKLTLLSSLSTGASNSYAVGGAGGDAGSSGSFGSTSITSSVFDFMNTTTWATRSNASLTVDPTSYTTSFLFSTAAGQTSLQKLTLFRDGRPNEAAGWSYTTAFTSASGATYIFRSTTSSVSTRSSTTGQVPVQVGSSTYSIQTTTLASSSVSGSGTLSAANGISTLVTSKTYNSTTITDTTTASNFTTTTSTRASTYPVAFGATSSGGSSQDTFTTRTQILSTITRTTYASTTTQMGGIQDTIHEIDSSEWAWIVTTTGIKSVGVNGLSYTGTITISATGLGVNVSVVGFSAADGTSFSTQTFTSTSFISGTTSSTRTTTSSSTYRTAEPTSVADSIPFSITTKTVSLTYITTRTTNYTYTSDTTTTTLGQQMATAPESVYTSSSTVTQNITTTFSGGTSLTTFTQTIPVAYSNFLKDNHTSSTRSTTQSIGPVTSTSRATTTGFSTTTATYNATTPRVNASLVYRGNTSSTSPLPVYTDITIQRGFQALDSLGSAYPFGTNLAASPSLPMHYACASVYRSGPVTPIMSPDEAQTFPGVTTMVIGGVAYTANATLTTTASPGTTYAWGSVAINVDAPSSMSLSNTLSATQLGGFGWDPAAGTTISGSTGIHRVTLFDSTSFTVTELTWASITSYSIPAGVGFVAESVPQAFSQSAQTPNTTKNLLTFSAFPDP